MCNLGRLIEVLDEATVQELLDMSTRTDSIDYPIDLVSLNYRTKTYVFRVGDYECRLMLPDYKIISRLKGGIPEKVNLALSSDIKIYCSCPDFKYRFKYIADKLDFGIRKEPRPPKVTNPQYNGSICKHLFHLLSNIENYTDEMSDLMLQKSKVGK